MTALTRPASTGASMQSQAELPECIERAIRRVRELHAKQSSDEGDYYGVFPLSSDERDELVSAFEAALFEDYEQDGDDSPYTPRADVEAFRKIIEPYQDALANLNKKVVSLIDDFDAWCEDNPERDV